MLRFNKVKRNRFNNFQRQETARWLLNISQGSALGGVGSLFIPGIGERIGSYVVLSVILSFLLYFGAMYIGREVKNND